LWASFPRKRESSIFRHFLVARCRERDGSRSVTFGANEPHDKVTSNADGRYGRKAENGAQSTWVKFESGNLIS
jgi:hypothetical protein